MSSDQDKREVGHSSDDTERYVPDGWKVNPTHRDGWSWALYNCKNPGTVPHEVLDLLHRHYDAVQVECTNRLRVLVRSVDTESDRS